MPASKAGAGAHAVHLVGTVPLSSTAEVLDLVADTTAPFMRRIPDGETGARSYWVSSQARVLHEDPHFEPAGHDWAPGRDMPETGAPKYRLRAGIDPATVEIGSFGYGAFARESYPQFHAMKQSGRIAPETRFQVGLPTPMGFFTSIVAPESQAAVAPAFERRMRQELDDLLAIVPHDELAIQWDACLEIFVWEGLRQLPDTDDQHQAVLDAMIRLGNMVPMPVELGYHLCYGDFRHKHGVEPKDAANMVTIANALTAGIARPINWIHMPVPRDRDDDAYFAPLADLKLADETELYLGLIHYTDGEKGTRRRMQTAARHVAQFGIATECGLGRRDPADDPGTDADPRVLRGVTATSETLPVAILGAGGATARPLVAALQARGVRVRAVVRRPERCAEFADARVADLADVDQITRAIEGTSAVHLIPPLFNTGETDFAANAIAAARLAGVARLTYHSVLHAPTPAMPHHWRKSQVEQIVRDSPLAWTIVQPAMYMQTGFTFLDRRAAAYTCPFDLDRCFNPVDALDLADAVATILTEEGHDYATYELAGGERLSARDMAQQIAAVIGAPLDVRQVPAENFAIERAARRGLDARQTAELRAMYAHYDAHGLLGNGRVLDMLLGRPSIRFIDAARRDLTEKLR